MNATPFVNIVGTFGDHPTRNANRHLQTQRHKDVVSNKLAFDNLSKRRADVWKLLQEAALLQKFLWQLQIVLLSAFLSFFQITWLLVKKNWAHSHNFKSIVELVAAYSGEEIKKHLLYAPQNANYVSPEYIFKCIQIMDDHIKLPLLASLRSSDPFLFFIDGTSDVTMTKQMTI